VSSVVNNGFFVDVGPLTVFVSVQVWLIPGKSSKVHRLTIRFR
jgi:hypothetical protein